jgi:hypothetical protein
MLEVRNKETSIRGAEIRYLFRPGKSVPAESFPVIVLVENGKVPIVSWAVACQILHDFDPELASWLPAIPAVGGFPDIPAAQRTATVGRRANLWRVWTLDATGLWLEREG